MHALSGMKLALGLVFLLSFPVKVSALGEYCTDADSSNCTAPSETCSNLVCACSEGYTEEDSNCRIPRPNEACLTSVGCNGSTCEGGTCQCLTSEYFDVSSSKCTPKKNYSSDCVNSLESQCRGDIVCLNGKCECPSDQYNHGTLTNPVCSPKKNYSSNCVHRVESQCRGDIVCLNGKCECPSDQYNSGNVTNPVCSPRLTHASQCTPALNPCVDGLSCVKDKTNLEDRCLCNPVYDRFWTGGANCSPVSDLKVTFTSPPDRKTTSIKLTWSQSVSPAPSDLKYFAVGGSTSTEVATSTTTSHTFTKLTPGTMYSLSIKTVLAEDDYYPVRSISSRILDEYTLPAQPGPVDESKSFLITPPYNLTFGASVGKVDQYRFNITPPTIDGQSTFTLTGTTTTPTLNLTANTEYQYQIIAIRGLDESEPRIGTFSTDSSRSGPVSYVSVTPQENSATLKWGRPALPNGVLTGYTIQVDKNNDCQYILLVECVNCSVPDGCQINKTEYYRNANLSATLDLEVNLTSLDPYQEYTVNISAFNVKGQGTPFSQSFMTLGAAPQEIKSVTLTPLDRDLNNQVSLKINWTPGKFTGPTNFTLKIFRETSLNSGKYEVNSTINVEGYENTEYNKSDVLAYWNYKVEVQAVTEKGSSGFVSSSIQKTEPSEPGNIGGLQINQDPKIAAMVDMNLTCPVETKRNGRNWTFVIERDPSFATSNTRSVDAGLCSGSSFYDSEVSVGTNYTYKVRFVNHKYEGNYTESSPVYLKPKAPKLDTVTPVFRSPGESKEKGTSTVNIELEATDLRDISNKQGTISNMALIVCTKFKDNDCNNGIQKRTKRSVTVADLGSYYTYDQASKRGFNIPYRATPNDWHTMVLSAVPSYSYTVGGETNCPTSSPTYCNGPLPDGKDFVFFLVVCNAAGCVDYKSDVYTTEVNPEEDSNIGVIVGAVVGVIVVIALVVVLIVFVMRRRRGRPKSDTSAKDPEPVDMLTKKRSEKTAKDPEPINLLSRKRPVKIREFKQHVRRFHEDQNLLFENEFADLKNESLNFNNTSKKVTRNGKKAKDMSHNNASSRMEAITNCDETMMLLKANYIMGVSSLRDYIATQDPMPRNIPDFWRMIWEQNCKVIVMLSDLMETQNQQVSLYWLENQNVPIHCGDVVVNMTHFFRKKKYIIRHFRISLGNVTRLVTHFCLSGLHDFSGNHIINDVIEFAHQVRQEVASANCGPIVVHCSAGVGLTGTFIALDYFLQYVDKKGLDAEIDIYSFVLEMRRNRPRMVQAEPHYILIFDALAEVIEKKIEEERRMLYDNPDFDPTYEVIPDHCYETFDQSHDDPRYMNNPDKSHHVYRN